MPDTAALTRLLADLRASLDDAMDGLESGQLSLDDWQQRVALDLLTTHTAGYLLGSDQDALTPAALERITQIVGEQVDYLNNFADAIDATGTGDAAPWDAWRARLGLYAGAVQHSFWRGATFGLDLPAYPGDGQSECLGHCGCVLEVDMIDPEELTADIWWVRGKDDSCPTCVEREKAWNPLHVEAGEVVG